MPCILSCSRLCDINAMYIVLQSFDLHIVERPVRYVQKVVTDLAENHVTYHVPSHNNVLESHKIQDFKKVCKSALI